MHAFDSLTHGLQTLNTEKQAVDDITNRLVELEKALASLHHTADSKIADQENEKIERRKLLHIISKIKLKQKPFGLKL